MEYLLESYRQTANVRVFVFDGIASDRTHNEFTVSVDTALIARYTIGLQELPLLCRQFLEKRVTAGGSRTLTFAETDMSSLADERAEVFRSLQQRKFNRRHPKPSSPTPLV